MTLLNILVKHLSNSNDSLSLIIIKQRFQGLEMRYNYYFIINTFSNLVQVLVYFNF
jgi:hypothetical protein